MSCGCENARLSKELDRCRRLAKAWARMEGMTAAIWREDDGSYGFCSANAIGEKEIVEYITPY